VCRYISSGSRDGGREIQGREKSLGEERAGGSSGDGGDDLNAVL
jgi:hypothetical protein